MYLPPYKHNLPTYTLGLIPTSGLENGILGIGLWLLWLFMVVKMLSKISIREEDDTNLKSILISFSSVLLLALIVLEPTALTLLLGVVVFGILINISPQRELSLSVVWFRNHLIKKITTVAIIILVTAAIIGISIFARVSFIYYQAIDDYFSNYSQSNPRDSSQDFEIAYQQLDKLKKYRKHYRYYRALAEIEYEAIERHFDKETPLNSNEVERINWLLEEAVENIEIAMALYPDDYRNWVVAVQIYSFAQKIGVKNSDRLAVEATNGKKVEYRVHAIRLSWHHPLPRYQEAEVHFLAGDLEKASESVETALKRKSNFAPALELKKKIGDRLRSEAGSIESGVD